MTTAFYIDKFGGPDLRPLSGAEVTVFAAKPLYGVVCKYELEEGKLLLPIKLRLTSVFRETRRKRVKPGTECPLTNRRSFFSNNKITAKSLDDRAGIAALLAAAEKLKKCGRNSRKRRFLFSQFEEIGGMGALTEQTFSVLTRQSPWTLDSA